MVLINLGMQVLPDTLEMAGQAYQELSGKIGFNPVGEIFFSGGLRDVRAGGAPCQSLDCTCCRWWAGTADLALEAAYRSLNLPAILAGKAAIAGDAAGRLQKERDVLAVDNERLSRANKKPNAGDLICN